VADTFPESNQVRLLGMEEAEDRAIWEYAKASDFILVSQDSDFADIATLFGPPPKVIWLRCGNQPTYAIEQRLREHAEGYHCICGRRSNGVLGNLLGQVTSVGFSA